LKNEVFDPKLGSGIEQKAKETGLRIERAEVSPFVPVAAPTGECQVSCISQTAMLSGYYVIYFVREESDFGW
jgi:hypothetical protein